MAKTCAGVALAVVAGLAVGRLLANCYVLHEAMSDLTCPSTGSGCPQPVPHATTPMGGYCANWLITRDPRFAYYQALQVDYDFAGMTDPLDGGMEWCGTMWVCQWVAYPAPPQQPTDWYCSYDHPLEVNNQVVLAMVHVYDAPQDPTPCPEP